MKNIQRILKRKLLFILVFKFLFSVKLNFSIISEKNIRREYFQELTQKDSNCSLIVTVVTLSKIRGGEVKKNKTPL